MPNYVIWLLYLVLAVPITLLFGWSGLIGYTVTIIILEVLTNLIERTLVK